MHHKGLHFTAMCLSGATGVTILACQVYLFRPSTLLQLMATRKGLGLRSVPSAVHSHVCNGWGSAIVPNICCPTLVIDIGTGCILRHLKLHHYTWHTFVNFGDRTPSSQKIVIIGCRRKKDNTAHLYQHSALNQHLILRPLSWKGVIELGTPLSMTGTSKQILRNFRPLEYTECMCKIGQ